VGVNSLVADVNKEIQPLKESEAARTLKSKLMRRGLKP